jgi:YVTN family beta-propeller protein
MGYVQRIARPVQPDPHLHLRIGHSHRTLLREIRIAKSYPLDRSQRRTRHWLAISFCGGLAIAVSNRERLIAQSIVAVQVLTASASIWEMIPGPLLAISRTEANQITLLELSDPEREIATIPVNHNQPFGLAFDETRQKLYAACWTDAKISTINLNSLKEEASIRAAKLPAWATRREGTGEIWISNEGAAQVTIFDSRTGKASGQIATGRGPSDIAFTENGRQAWVSNEEDRNVSLIDAAARRRIGDIRVGEVPQGISLTRSRAYLLVANFGSNSVSLLDIASTKELTQIAVGRGPVDVITVAQGRLERAWVTCFSEGAVSLIDLGQRTEIQRIATGGRPQGIEVHPNGDRVYVSVRDLNELAVLDTGTPSRILRRISMSGGPARMVIAP